MPDRPSLQYCGVPLRDIVSALQEAAQFLRHELPYPAVRAALDQWEAQDPFGKIAAAADGAAAGHELGETGTKALLHNFREVFEYQAMANPDGRSAAGRTNLELYKSLAAWGAFDYSNTINGAAPLLNEPALRLERDSHLIAHYARILGPDLSDAQTRRLVSFFTRSRKEAPTDEARMTAYGAPEVIQELFDLQSRNGPEAGIAFCSRLEPEMRSFVRDALYELHGYGLKRLLLLGHSPFQVYGLVVPAQAGNRQAALAAVRTDLKDLLQPRLRDEWVRVANSAGFIPYDRSKLAVMFYATRQVAQEVADALPKKEVVDQLGRRIQPRSGGPDFNRPNPPGGPGF